MFNPDIVREAICAATREVFETMLGLDASAGEPRFERNPTRPTGGVVSLIGLAGAWVGTGSLCCNPSLACKLSSHLLMSEMPIPEAVNEEVLDSFAELTNMIVGNVKTALEEHLGPMGLSVPTVVYGRNFTTRTVAGEEWLIVPFECANELLEVKLCLTRSREACPVRYGYPAPATVQS
jgi:chemotaxis protein CheX